MIPTKCKFPSSSLLKIKPIWSFATQPLVWAMQRKKTHWGPETPKRTVSNKIKGPEGHGLGTPGVRVFFCYLRDRFPWWSKGFLICGGVAGGLIRSSGYMPENTVIQLLLSQSLASSHHTPTEKSCSTESWTSRAVAVVWWHEPCAQAFASAWDDLGW